MSRDRLLIFTAAFLRSTAIGSIRIFIGIYFIHVLGLQAAEAGLAISAGLAGVTLSTLAASFFGDRLGRRKCLSALLVLHLAGIAGLVWLRGLATVLAASFFGMVNARGRDRGAAVALESAALPQTASDRERTLVFAWYNVLMDIGHGLGALVGALPEVLRNRGLGEEESYRAGFLVYATLMALALASTLLLTRKVELGPREARPVVSSETKRNIGSFAALSFLDSLGGADSILPIWFSLRYAISEGTMGPIFSAGYVLNAVSHLGAARLAAKIGLLPTMVFTHLPANCIQIGMAFMPSFEWAAALYLARELLIEMDVPTRQSYLTAIVRPEERTAAAGIVGVARSLGAATAPTVGLDVTTLVQGAGAAAGPAPLVLLASIKICYDLALFRLFRGLKPPEEAAAHIPKRP